MPLSRPQLVLVLDDDKLLRQSFRLILEAAGYRVETFGTGQEFLASELPNRPACLILDMQMPNLSGLEVQQKLAEYRDRLPIIFVSAHGTVAMTAQAMKMGAVDFLTKPVPSALLISVVQQALKQAENGYLEHVGHKEVRDRWLTLTPREQEVFRWLITGRLNKQIAGELGTTERTIKAHRKQVLDKMGVLSVAELVWLAKKGRITPAGNNLETN